MKVDSSCIELNNVNKWFGDKQILRDINLKVPYGKVYGLLGPSGCGKTTTVKLIAGALEATSGEVFVLGEKMPELDLMGRLGYMAQSDALYVGISAYENLKFFSSMYGMQKGQAEERINEAMNLMNLSEDIHKMVAVYSGGMKRRLSLAMSILHEPEVLILDEPTVGIDPVLRKDIWQELYRRADMGVTILITTHVMDEAEKCHELAMMRNGRIIAQGTPLELQEQIGVNRLEDAFIYYGGCGYED